MEGETSTRGLGTLRARIASCDLPRRSADSLLIATWNIRELGKRPRRPESLVYIAEILRHFDLVSIVELRENLTDLDRVLELLGPSWKALFTSPLFDDAGNRERAAYVYDTTRVHHTGLASCPQAPRQKKGEEWISSIGWWRSPYFASFGAGTTELLLLTAHVRWGARSSARDNELSLLADWVATDLAKDPFSSARDVLVLGDFNIPSFESPLFETIQRRGLRIPEALRGQQGTNLKRDKRYDQILHLPASADAFTGKGGAVDFYAGDHHALYPRSVSFEEFTHEMSDHLPPWVQIRTQNEQ